MPGGCRSAASGPPDTKSGGRDESCVPRECASSLGSRPCAPRAGETGGAHSPGERAWGGAAGPAPPPHVPQAGARSPRVGTPRRKARGLPGCAPGSRQVGRRESGAQRLWARRDRGANPATPPALASAPGTGVCAGSVSSLRLRVWDPGFCKPDLPAVFFRHPGRLGGGEVTLKVRVPRESSCSTQPLKTRSYRRCRPAVCEVFATSLQLSGPSAEVDLNSWRAVGIGSRAWPSLTTRRLNGRA